MLVRSQNGSIALLAARLVLPQRFQWRITTGPMTLAALPSRRAKEPALTAQFQSSAGVSGRSGSSYWNQRSSLTPPMSSTIFFGGQVFGGRRERVWGGGANGVEEWLTNFFNPLLGSK